MQLVVNSMLAASELLDKTLMHIHAVDEELFHTPLPSCILPTKLCLRVETKARIDRDRQELDKALFGSSS
jgi:hypothetical protein